MKRGSMPDYKERPHTDYIVVHCADTDPHYHGHISIADVRKWHVKENGWIDVGYHFFITRSGAVEIGRPLWAKGAHVKGHNHESLGICLEGGCQIVDGEKLPTALWYTDNQMYSLQAILASMEMKYPDAEVLGHRDFPGVDKYCPSFDVQAWWDEARPEQQKITDDQQDLFEDG